MHTQGDIAGVSTPPGQAVLEQLPSGVALVRLGPVGETPVTLTIDRINSLKAILERLKKEKPKGVIFTGPSLEMFTVGADLSLIRDVTDPALGERLAREGQKTFDLISELPCPTVAAISGPCVGGGCELVLACGYRIISDDKSSVIGLPEIKLGILPGFGGTQRLPRLTGITKALDVILAGRTVKPKHAQKVGLVNEVIASSRLLERAEGIVLGNAKRNEIRLRWIEKFLTFNSFGRNFVAKKARAKVLKETKGFYPAPPAALDSVLYGLERGMSAGLLNEAKELGRLIVTPESKCLVRLFFLTEASKAIGKSARAEIKQIQGCVIGAGVMGAGIAGLLARNECPVILKDSNQEALSRAQAHIKEYVSKIRDLSEAEKSFVLNRVETTTRDSANIANSNLIIEAVFEDIGLKKKILQEISKVVQSEAILATNTSSLSVTQIADGIDHPERVVGMHFFNPVEKMPLVEIIHGKATSDRTIAIVAALSSKMGKFPIVVGDVPGFLVNRILAPYLNEAAYLLSEGYSVKDIDKAALSFGMPMGPIRLLDEIGLDVASHVSEVMVKGYGQRMQGPGFAKDLAALGRKGKKSGGGFYDFSADGSEPWGELRTALKLPAEKRPSYSTELIDRLILVMINEAVMCLDQGVAGVPGADAANQIDLGTVMGTGFPPFRGGLLYYAQSIGPKVVFEKLSGLERSFGMRFAPATGVKSRAETGKSFFERV